MNRSEWESWNMRGEKNSSETKITKDSIELWAGRTRAGKRDRSRTRLRSRSITSKTQNEREREMHACVRECVSVSDCVLVRACVWVSVCEWEWLYEFVSESKKWCRPVLNKSIIYILDRRRVSYRKFGSSHSLSHKLFFSFSFILTHTYTHTHTLTLTHTHSHSLTHTHSHTKRLREKGVLWCTNACMKLNTRIIRLQSRLKMIMCPS